MKVFGFPLHMKVIVNMNTKFISMLKNQLKKPYRWTWRIYRGNIFRDIANIGQYTHKMICLFLMCHCSQSQKRDIFAEFKTMIGDYHTFY